MSGSPLSDGSETYTNPVYPHSFPDPFVLKHRGRYYGFCTGFGVDGNVFPVIASSDLVNWQEVGSAMTPLAAAPPFYWAPEVTYDNGRFYLYYSCGNETLMHIRVAVSDSPDGGFVDSGHILTTQDFAIDPHVFTDRDGSRYMFYATDFLEHSHIGTGTVIEKMKGWFELEGDPRPVTRAKYDWQIYDPARAEKGGVKWHTVEGPTVLERKGKYFQMFSGGNWQNTTYGVSFAAAPSISFAGEWTQFSDGEKVLPILRTIPGVVGPGHNSVVRGPNARELYCVYHRWTDAGRVMAIDRLDFAGDRIFVIGATLTPQIAPFRPSISVPPNDGRDDAVSINGEWELTDGEALTTANGKFERHYRVSGSFLFEFTVRCNEWKGSEPAFGFRLMGGEGEHMEFVLLPGSRTASLSVSKNGTRQNIREFYLPLDLTLAADHLFRVDVNERSVSVAIDAAALSFDAALEFGARGLAIVTRGSAATFSGITVTEGFEDLFIANEARPEAGGWTMHGTQSLTSYQKDGELYFSSRSEGFLRKGRLFGSAEFAANIRFADPAGDDGEVGIQLLDSAGMSMIRLGLSTGGVKFDPLGAAESLLVKPENFDPQRHQQLRIVKLNDRLIAMIDDITIADLSISLGPTHFVVYCNNASAAVDMARAIAI